MSRTTKIANIPRVPNNIDRGLANFLNSVKESIEVARGRAGDPDSYVTKKYLEEHGYPSTTPTTPSTPSSGSSSTPTQAALGLHSVKTANIADRAVTAIKIAEGVVPGDDYILTLIKNYTGTYLWVPVADIDAPVELANFTNTDGKMILAYEIDANQDHYTLYAFDSANASGASSPYVVAGAVGFWVAIAGTHASGIRSFILDDDGIIGLGAAKGRIEFDDQATDEINFLDCVVGVGTSTPVAKVAINGGLHVGGDSDPGDNNLLVDGTIVATGSATSSAGLLGQVLGDGTAGRVLRQLRLRIQDGTNASTIKCQIVGYWNGDDDGPTDNVAKGATTGNYTLNAAGSVLQIEAAGLSGDCEMALGTVSYNATTTALNAEVYAGANDIIIEITNLAGASLDVTALADTGNLNIMILYLTDA